MHNLHYLVVEAENAQEACTSAEEMIESWGDENNWRHICGAVNAKGEVYNGPEGRWEPNSLKDVQESVKRWMFEDDSFGAKAFKEAIAKLNAGEDMDTMDWYHIQKHAELEGDRCMTIKGFGSEAKVKPEEVDVFKHEFRSWKLDECGVTHLSNLEKVKPKNKWVVLLDMHS